MSDLNSNLSREVQTLSSQLDYCDFLNEYLLENKICHLGLWVTDKWRSRTSWVLDHQPNVEYLKTTFGSAVDCPVANCGKQEYDSHCKNNLSFADYMQYFADFDEKLATEERRILYLKDWHFTKIFPDYKAYETPIFFQSDWLNEFLDEKGWELEKECDDYRFVYIGPKGSWTPLHSDVLGSHSWSANICGTKSWTFFVPGEENKLRDRYGNLPFDIREVEIDETVEKFEVIQREGEVLFVPSGWYHQVHNLENTISINHNWINGSNVAFTWYYLCSSLKDVEKEIEDCRDMQDWEQQCQLVLKASCGIDFAGFFNFLAFIALKRLENYQQDKDNGCESITRNDFSVKNIVSPNCKSHVMFDLIKIHEVLNKMLMNDQFKALIKLDSVSCKLAIEPDVLFHKLQQIK